MIKLSNYIILFILLIIGVIFKDSIHISTNLLSLFGSKDAIEKISIADNLGYSKEMLIAVKGFDKESKTKVQEISSKLEKIQNILFVQSSIVPSSEIKAYYEKNYSILSNFTDTPLSSSLIQTKLQELYDEQLNNIFYTPVDKNDPLKLFEFDKNNNLNMSHKGSYITLGDYGYLIRVSTDVSASQMDKAKKLYTDVQNLLNDYENVTSFAPFYYTVENSTKIKDDLSWIIILSSLILLMVYYLLIKNIKLLSHTLVALMSSMLVAGYASMILFANFNALSLAFGMSITAVSIDYLLHYHFHNFYKSKKSIDKNVLYGYITTVIAFGIFSFIPIALISQISFFAVVSLSFAYLLFTFVFPHLDIDEYTQNKDLIHNNKKVKAYIFSILSILLFAYSALNINFDNDIKNLDYQNKKLLETQSMFDSFNKSKLSPVIVQAKTSAKLIDNLHILKNNSKNSYSLANFVKSKSFCQQRKKQLQNYDFKRLNKEINIKASKIGFRDDYFKDAYTFLDELPKCEIKNFDMLKQFSLSTYKDKDSYYSIALVEDTDIANKFDFISIISAKEIFAKVAQQMYKDLLLYASIVIGSIFILLILSVKGKILYALNYIIFPLSVTLAILVSYTDLNIMHIFSLIILMAIGIDYGIYMSNTQKPNNTMLAIKYSILSTFAAFGVLIFSTIVALNSIGVVISIGICAIFILIKVMK